jgi:hypothetical protein
MLRYTRLVRCACALALMFTCDVGSIFADGGLPVPFYQEVFTNTSFRDFLCGFYYKILLEIFCATVAIEYLVVFLLLGRPPKAKIKLFCYILLINLITNPAEQFAIFFLADPDLLGSTGRSLLMICLIEFVVITIEFGLMLWIFRRMYRRGMLQRAITAGHTIVLALVANVASSGILFIGFILIIALSNK